MFLLAALVAVGVAAGAALVGAGVATGWGAAVGAGVAAGVATGWGAAVGVGVASSPQAATKIVRAMAAARRTYTARTLED